MKRKPSPRVMLGARIGVGGTQLIAAAVCVSAAWRYGIWIGWLGAASTILVGLIMFFSPES